MKIDWIKFYGSYNDCRYEIGVNGVKALFIEVYSTQPFCGTSQLTVAFVDGVESVRSLEGVNYDFKKTNTQEGKI